MLSAHSINVTNQLMASGGIGILTGESLVILSTPSKLLINQGNTSTLAVQGLIDTTTLNFTASGALSGALIDQYGNPVILDAAGDVVCILTYQAGNPFPGTFIGSFGDNTFYPTVGPGYTIVIDGVFNAVYYHAEILAEIVANAG